MEDALGKEEDVKLLLKSIHIYTVPVLYRPSMGSLTDIINIFKFVGGNEAHVRPMRCRWRKQRRWHPCCRRKARRTAQMHYTIIKFHFGHIYTACGLYRRRTPAKWDRIHLYYNSTYS